MFDCYVVLLKDFQKYYWRFTL